MMRKSRLHQFAIILTLFFLVALLLPGCSKSVPGCDDEKTVKAVINTVSQDFKKGSGCNSRHGRSGHGTVG